MAKSTSYTHIRMKILIADAELVFTLMLGIDRRLADSTAALRAHQWNKKEFSKADGIFGKTPGIIGLDAIRLDN